VELLSNKYISGPKILYATTLPKESPTWSSIVHAKNALKDGYSWRAGSCSSSFWFCPWRSLGYIGLMVPYIDIPMVPRFLIEQNPIKK